MAALRYGFFIEFLSPRATADLKRLGPCSGGTTMKCLGLSAFLTITALSVAGLVSQSAAQQGPSATPPAASPAPGSSATQPPAPPAQQGPCQQIMAACRQAGFVQNGASTGVGLAVDCVRPIVQGTAQRPKASKPLPQVDQQIVAACKASNPNFGKANPQQAGKPKQTAPQ
jgi:hypothetical protein